MWLRSIIILFLICCRSVFAVKNFWDNDICTTDNDCTGLTSCHSTFGCTVSVAKVALVVFAVFLALVVIITALVCLCIRGLGNTMFSRPQNQYLPRTIITTNAQPQWNQIGGTTTAYTHTTVAYPHNPSSNQFFANYVNPPIHNQLDIGARMNVHPAPTAPYGPAGYPN